ncbi:hypothetical protein K814_0124155 [Pseudomonas fluorescens LMG 5329]|uniref:Uncharacterized protein n=1 Tax=Pseudomonas fluorescens LMG 5329 TaxID=1324332 RepID=A0A0A1YU18_PSEFL|nr:hypothetical protein K814_0124155 [Pseudomonas fluorescens LMG 5329]
MSWLEIIREQARSQCVGWCSLSSTESGFQKPVGYQAVEFQLWNAVNGGSGLAREEAITGTTYLKVLLRNELVAKYV